MENGDNLNQPKIIGPVSGSLLDEVEFGVSEDINDFEKMFAVYKL
jgi:hypothetical protein